MNDVNQQMLEFAKNVAKYAQKTKTENERFSSLRYFIGNVVGYSDGMIQVSRPFDDTVMTLRYASSAGSLAPGTPCFVLIPGSLSNAIVLGDGTLSNL